MSIALHLLTQSLSNPSPNPNPNPSPNIYQAAGSDGFGEGYIDRFDLRFSPSFTFGPQQQLKMVADCEANPNPDPTPTPTPTLTLTLALTPVLTPTPTLTSTLTPTPTPTLTLTRWPTARPCAATRRLYLAPRPTAYSTTSRYSKS